MEDITFVTGNKHKAAELSKYLGIKLKQEAVDLVEIQSLDLKEIAEDKARRAYEIVGSSVLVEDTSLVIDELGKLPGPLIKWFLNSVGNEGITKLIRGEERRSTAQVIFCLFDGSKTEFFTGAITGRISEVPRGEQGFGWDSIFIPDGHEKTWGEMTEEEKDKTSMRKLALTKLGSYLRDE